MGTGQSRTADRSCQPVRVGLDVDLVIFSPTTANRSTSASRPRVRRRPRRRRPPSRARRIGRWPRRLRALAATACAPLIVSRRRRRRHRPAAPHRCRARPAAGRSRRRATRPETRPRAARWCRVRCRVRGFAAHAAAGARKLGGGVLRPADDRRDLANGSPNISWSTNASRSAGEEPVSTTNSAAPIESASGASRSGRSPRGRCRGAGCQLAEKLLGPGAAGAQVLGHAATTVVSQPPLLRTSLT